MNRAELEDHLLQYIAHRKSLGYRQVPAGTLRRFVHDYTEEYPAESIQVGHVLDWVTRGTRSPQTQSGILCAVRDFLRFVSVTDQTTGIPDSHLLRSPRRSAPYIWTTEQLQTLLTAAKGVQPHRGLRAAAYVAVLGLIASSGLRISEALHLQVADVCLDAEQPHVVVRETKFKKSRIVPLHTTVVKRLKDYADRRTRHCHARRAHTFFVTDRGQPIDQKYMERWFAGITDKIGLRTPPGRRPTIHSLRHTFAVRRLTQWYEEGKSVWELVPNLSVFLGHVSPAESYWYISATPDLLNAASDRFSSYLSSGDPS